MNIRDYYKYSLLSTLAYVDWRGISINNDDPGPAIVDANTAERVPGNAGTSTIDTLGEKIFSPIAVGGEQKQKGSETNCF